MYDNRFFMTIAASDNSGGAGIQQDLKVAESLSFWGLSVLTGITVQDFEGLDKIYPLPLDLIQEQFYKNVKSFPLGIIKIGALCSLPIAQLVIDLLKDYPQFPVVVDPVIAPTQGKSFLEKKDIDVYLELLTCANLVTPNKHELELLTNQKISSYQEALDAASYLVKKTSCNVYIKGGHFIDKQDKVIKEYLVTKNDISQFSKSKQSLSYSHGTGCFFSTALACNFLLLGNLEAACKKSTEEVSEYYSKLKF